MERFQRFCHANHRLTLHEFYEGTNNPVLCFACCEVISGPAYVCESQKHFSCRLYCLHRSCAELPGEIHQHPLHSQHPLTVTDFAWLHVTSYGFICDGCRHYSWGFKYECKECNFKLDIQCVSKHEGQPLMEDAAVEVSYHQHRLQLFNHRLLLSNSFYEDIICVCCLKGFRDSAYACIECPLFIHKYCLDIPQQVQCPIHPKELLEVNTVFGHATECLACETRVRSIGLFCSHKCLTFHICCGEQNTNGLRVEFHAHNMFNVYSRKESWSCTICKRKCEGDIYRCMECRVNVHLECIPLPSLVEHDCHHHPLLLTNLVQPHNEFGEYVCDICEKREYFPRPLYVCEKCNFITHVECVNSEEYPPWKILECLVPRTKTKGNTNKSVKESDDEQESYEGQETDDDEEKAEQQNYIDDKAADKSEEDIDEGHEMDEKEGENDLIDCSLEELEKRMADINKKIHALTLELKVTEKKHAKKLYSLS